MPAEECLWHCARIVVTPIVFAEGINSENTNWTDHEMTSLNKRRRLSLLRDGSDD